MKIGSGSQQQKVVEKQRSNGSEAAGSAAQRKTAGKRAQQGDQVRFSAALDEQLSGIEARQAQRVESIKGQLQAGSYQVSSIEVAKKMLAALRRK